MKSGSTMKKTFEIFSKNKLARVGKLRTKNGEINTPFFMPDATRGFIKLLSKHDLEGIGARPMVVNTYHLYLQPGMELIKKGGGIHKFMNWDGPLLSDSGGYQIFSLIHKNSKLGKITDEQAVFKSPIDGRKHELTPEKSIQIQFDLGVDMMVVLDDVPPVTYSDRKMKVAIDRTISWAKRCKIEYEKQIQERGIAKDQRPLLFGVIQGGKDAELRKYCAQELVKLDFDGYGFGARHVDENGVFMQEMVAETAKMIPEDKLRFALGVGTPEDIVRFVACGWDMFDCVIPTREGRHGRLFIWDEQSEFTNLKSQITNKIQNSKSKLQKSFYKTININNHKFNDDFSPVDTFCDCELCRNHSRAYLRHLFVSKDPLGMRLAAMHNLKFYLDLMEKLRAT
ncbi:MAG: Queuine tRNA-ribosyltransferase [Candidatus Moranbacteria bacterium GW2011_GWA2_39_41]|nr:MAG: Queuine tRNA-ribosyltransferase [Candidatus Moranbacteria bacterium GW2011_GWA2_39_41]